MRKQLEIENLQHTLDIQKDALEQKRKVFPHSTHTQPAHSTHTHHTVAHSTHTHTQSPTPHTHTAAHSTHTTHTQMFEDAMKSGQAEKHALEKQLMAQKQRLLEDTDSEKVFMEVKKQ